MKPKADCELTVIGIDILFCISFCSDRSGKPVMHGRTKKISAISWLSTVFAEET